MGKLVGWFNTARGRWVTAAVALLLIITATVLFVDRGHPGVSVSVKKPSPGTQPSPTATFEGSAPSPSALESPTATASSAPTQTSQVAAPAPTSTKKASSPTSSTGKSSTGKSATSSGSSSSSTSGSGAAAGGPGSGPKSEPTVAPGSQPSPVQVAQPAPSPIPSTAAHLITEVVPGGIIGQPSTAAGPDQFATATAMCPAGTVALGGGVKTTPPPDSPQPSPLHIDGSFPSDASGHPVASGASTQYWTAVVEEGMAVNTPASQTTSYVFALCGGGGGTLQTTVVETTVNGPYGGSGIVTTTASCPGGTLLVGGGANTIPGNEGIAGMQPSPLHLVASAPSDTLGEIVTGSGAAPRSWTAAAEEGADTSYTALGNTSGIPNISTTTTAFAICASGSALQATGVVTVRTTGPEAAGGYVTATASCPQGSVLVGGGTFVNAPPGTSQPSPLHLNGDYPSNDDGSAVTGPATLKSWGIVTETGNAIPGDSSTVYAICGS